MLWKPHLTVAAIAEREGRFLLVEERVDGRLVLNQPAGHVEDGENPLQAVVREAREETAWEFVPESLLGLYLWREPHSGNSYLRLAYNGRCTVHHPGQALDDGIERAVWLTPGEIAARQDALRSPLVLLCVQDRLRGRGYGLDLLQHVLAAAAEG